MYVYRTEGRNIRTSGVLYTLPDASSHFHHNVSTVRSLSVSKESACRAVRRENSQVLDLCVRCLVRAGTVPRTRCRTLILLHETVVTVISENDSDII